MTVFNAANARPMPTQQELWNMFSYDEVLGVLRWKVPRRSINVGDIAGCVGKDGYTQIQINGIFYLAHRLIYQYHKGDLGQYKQIDHYDKNPRNNKFDNLRLATHSQNQRNTPVYANSKSGIKGVIWEAEREKYRAQIKVTRKVENLGRFTNKFDAYEVYRQRCLEVDPISYSDNSKDMRPEVLIEYQNYLLQKTIIAAVTPNRQSAINDQKFNIFELAA